MTVKPAKKQATADSRPVYHHSKLSLAEGAAGRLYSMTW